MIALTQALERELAGTAFAAAPSAPAFVDTPMTDWIKGQVAAEEMIRPEDIAESCAACCCLSRAGIVPEVMMVRPSDLAAGGV